MVYKKLFKVFPDDRGYLNPIDLEYLLNAINKPNFSLSYQLISSSKEKNVFRGFHYQRPPDEQKKILIVHQGSIKDIVFPISAKKFSDIHEYDLEAGDVIVIPENFAHGFYTKSSNVLLQYLMDKKFSPENYTGFNPKKYIQSFLPHSEFIVSSKDKSLPELPF